MEVVSSSDTSSLCYIPEGPAIFILDAVRISDVTWKTVSFSRNILLDGVNQKTWHKLQNYMKRNKFNPPYRAALSQLYSVAKLRVLSSLQLSGLRCSCCNVVRFFCDLEACILVADTIALPCVGIMTFCGIGSTLLKFLTCTKVSDGPLALNVLKFCNLYR
jgi:hypothetical protein